MAIKLMIFQFFIFSNERCREVAFISDPAERRENATLILGQICGSSAFQPYLKQLLSAQDAQGQTPFMLAVSSRAYQAAKNLLNVIQQVANGDMNLRDAMIFPPGSSPDQSPLYVLCCNDTCSFTWTGGTVKISVIIIVQISNDFVDCFSFKMGFVSDFQLISNEITNNKMFNKKISTFFAFKLA